MHSHTTKWLIPATVVAAGTAGLLAVTAPGAQASGFGGVGASCSNARHGCTVTAHGPGSSSPGGSDSSSHPGTGTSSQDSGTGSSPSAVTCIDDPISPTPQQLAAFGTPSPPSGNGHWVIVECTVANMPGINATLQWQADGAPTLPAPAVLAAQAESKLVLAKPVVDSSPTAAVPQVVQLPTWTWMPKAQWVPMTATASVPGESVTATATPVELAFAWGDGKSSVCQGPGTPYKPGSSDPSAPSPTCGHTYHVTSAAAPGQQFPVTATLSWSVAWAGGGATGTFPDLTTTTTVHWTVEQVQSVLVQGGGA